MKPRLVVAALALAFAAGCGGGSSDGGGSSTPTSAPATSDSGAGKQIFTDNCSTCHTLKADNATGKVGPNLDQLRPGPDLVTHQVTNGGGGMPAFKGKLTDAQIKQVAAYVSQNAGQ